MTVWSTLNACLASVATYAGLHNLFHYAHRERRPATLLFALGCFSAALYDVSGMGLYRLTSNDDPLFWQRLQHVSLALLVFFLFWWAVTISGKRRRPWDHALGAYFLLHACMVAVYPGRGLWTSTPAIKTGSFFGLATVTYYEMEGTFTTGFIQFVGLATAVYTLYILVRYMFRSRRDYTLPLIIGVVVMAAAGVNDIGLSERWWTSIYLTEYSFTFLIIALAFNITREHIRSERALVSSLHEKESLLKEIHHRVKNNLQIVSGLLAVNEPLTRDPAAREVFRETHRRIASMALIHERLYQSGNLSRIDFGAYLKDLVGGLRAGILGTGTKVSVELDVDGSAMAIDTAIPSGLLSSELISNAMRHAFPDGRPGTITVRFRKLEPRRYELRVSDDGVGLPEGFDVKSVPTLGMKLVVLLVEQLEGSLDISRCAGTTFTIAFSEYLEAGTTLY